MRQPLLKLVINIKHFRGTFIKVLVSKKVVVAVLHTWWRTLSKALRIHWNSEEMPTVSSKVEEKQNQATDVGDISEEKVLSEKEKNEEIEILLEETPTTTLLSIRGLCVMNETEDFTQVSAANESYEKLVNSKATSDNFNERNAQTFNFAPKNKEVHHHL